MTPCPLSLRDLAAAHGRRNRGRSLDSGSRRDLRPEVRRLRRPLRLPELQELGRPAAGSCSTHLQIKQLLSGPLRHHPPSSVRLQVSKSFLLDVFDFSFGEQLVREWLAGDWAGLDIVHVYLVDLLHIL